jgi:hypothetical protein
LTAGTLSALLTAEMLATVTGYARYDYEVLSAGGVVLFVVLIALSGMVYLRWPHFHR